MKIQIVEKELKHILSLTSEEIVRLIRFQKATSRYGAQFEVISPILIIAGGKKFQVTLLKVTSEEKQPAYDPYSGMGMTIEEPKAPSSKIEFTAVGECTFDMVEPLVEADSILVLMRAKNRPIYCKMTDYKIIYDKEYATSKSLPPEYTKKLLIELKVKNVKPIEDLLKAQITEEQFYEVFVMGRSEEFFLGSGKDLDDLVGIIGIKRREDEDDYALRRRIVRYLKRQIEEPPIPDEDVNRVLRQTEAEQQIEGKIDDAAKKKKKKDEEETE